MHIVQSLSINMGGLKGPDRNGDETEGDTKQYAAHDEYRRSKPCSLKSHTSGIGARRRVQVASTTDCVHQQVPGNMHCQQNGVDKHLLQLVTSGTS